MRTKIYDANGYIRQDMILMTGETFIFEIGGRGTGKTYGALSYVLDHDVRFLLLRRTQTEADIIGSRLTTPFKAIMNDRPGLSIDCRPLAKNLYSFWDEATEENGKEEDVRIGYLAALSTFANVRGVDFSDVDLILFDEFIPEKRQRPIKDEYEALLNMYETVSRNRELQGKAPPVLCCMANANDIANPIFIGLEIVDRVAKMISTGQDYWRDPDRKLELYTFRDSPISEKKAETSLYKLTTGSSFQDMALRNLFELDTRAVSSRRLKEYRPLVRIGEMVVLQHKSRQEYYVRLGKSGTVPTVFDTKDVDRKRFLKSFGYLYVRYLSDMVIFESPAAQILFEKYFT